MVFSKTTFTRCIALIVIGTGFAVLVGWAFDIAPLKSIAPGFVSMAPITAFCFILTGTALEFLCHEQTSPALRRWVGILSWVVLLFALVRLAGYIIGENVAIDSLLLSRKVGSNRMAPSTATGFSLMGIALLCLRNKTRYGLVQWLAFVTGVIALTAMAGYAYDVRWLYTVGPFISMALHTAITFFLFSLAMLVRNSDVGPVASIRNWGERRVKSKALAVGFGVGLGTLLVMGVFAYTNARRLLEVSDWRYRTHQVIQLLQEIEIDLIDAETGQRGFILTGNELYLEPYNAAINRLPDHLDRFRISLPAEMRENPKIGELENLIQSRLKILNDNLQVRRSRGAAFLQNPSKLNDGKNLMDRIRMLVSEIQHEQAQALAERDQRVRRGSRRTIVTLIGCSVVGISLFLCTFYFLRRENLERKRAVSGLQNSRAELQSLFESLPGLYLVLTKELKIVAASDAYLAATMTQRDKILGRGLFEVFPDNPDDPKADGVSNLRSSLEYVREHSAAHTMAIQKYDIRRPNGEFEERYWSPINSPVLGANKQLSYIIHRVEDVTSFMLNKPRFGGTDGEIEDRLEKMKAEVFLSSQKIQQANQQLELANKESAAFSYSVSHDLRTPLRTIDGFSQVMLEDYSDKLDDTGRDTLQRIRLAAQHMSQLIDDMLTLSRLSRAAMNFEQADLSAMAHSIVSELSDQSPDRKVHVKIADGLKATGDARLLRVVLENLLSNAWKYTGKKSQANIEFGVRYLEDKQQFFVRDDGAGFEMLYVDKLFSPFQRLHTDEQFQGTGVGLATVQRIIQRHGGTVSAEGAVNHGATFYFTL